MFSERIEIRWCKWDSRWGLHSYPGEYVVLDLGSLEIVLRSRKRASRMKRKHAH